jgi:hypothetical protein
MADGSIIGFFVLCCVVFSFVLLPVEQNAGILS